MDVVFVLCEVGNKLLCVIKLFVFKVLNDEVLFFIVLLTLQIVMKEKLRKERKRNTKKKKEGTTNFRESIKVS